MTLPATPRRGLLVAVGVSPDLQVRFQYNPATLTDKRSVSYAALTAPGTLLPLHQYTGGGDRTISFTVLVNGAPDRPPDPLIERDEAGGIGPELAKYRAFVHPRTGRWPEAKTSRTGFTGLYTAQRHLFEAPPDCRFVYGDRVLECLVTEVSITEQLFTADLAPLRAEIQLTLTETTPYDPVPPPSGA
ncbi:hypothetical protein [Streptomyces sp. NPDC059010]|uniref:CIS tube protein n=1 Tax=Streptomyces sp. NPDC059010 TaxID=3346695 RepID=UPI0036BCF11E